MAFVQCIEATVPWEIYRDHSCKGAQWCSVAGSRGTRTTSGNNRTNDIICEALKVIFHITSASPQAPRGADLVPSQTAPERGVHVLQWVTQKGVALKTTLTFLISAMIVAMATDSQL
jgi:hypothetical protein